MPRIIDITCLEDLWGDIAAEVPMLASPDGCTPPFRWDQPSALAPQRCPPEKLEYQGDVVQAHINVIVGGKQERERREVRDKFNAAIGRATVRAGEIAKEKENEQLKEMLERAGAALRAATGRRAMEEVSTVAGDSMAGSSASSTSSSAWAGAGGHDSSASTSGEEDQPKNTNVQAQIRKATEAARQRRQAEMHALRNTGEEIQRAAREAWERREATLFEAAAHQPMEALVDPGVGGGWGSGGIGGGSSAIDEDVGPVELTLCAGMEHTEAPWQAPDTVATEMQAVVGNQWPLAIPYSVGQQSMVAPRQQLSAQVGNPFGMAAPNYMSGLLAGQEALRTWAMPGLRNTLPSPVQAWAWGGQLGFHTGDASDRAYPMPPGAVQHPAEAVLMQHGYDQLLQSQQQQQLQTSMQLVPQWGGC